MKNKSNIIILSFSGKGKYCSTKRISSIMFDFFVPIFQ